MFFFMLVSGLVGFFFSSSLLCAAILNSESSEINQPLFPPQSSTSPPLLTPLVVCVFCYGVTDHHKFSCLKQQRWRGSARHALAAAAAATTAAGKWLQRVSEAGKIHRCSTAGSPSVWGLYSREKD